MSENLTLVMEIQELEKEVAAQEAANELNKLMAYKAELLARLSPNKAFVGPALVEEVKERAKARASKSVEAVASGRRKQDEPAWVSGVLIGIAGGRRTKSRPAGFENVRPGAWEYISSLKGLEAGRLVYDGKTFRTNPSYVKAS